MNEERVKSITALCIDVQSYMIEKLNELAKIYKITEIDHYVIMGSFVEINLSLLSKIKQISITELIDEFINHLERLKNELA